MNILRLGHVLTSYCLFSFIVLAVPCSSAKTWNDMNVLDEASRSHFYGVINKLQAAEMLETIITNGQQRKIMLKYVGIDPRILATVHIDQIDIRFRKFDQFSQTPVGWSREGALMNDFKSKWSAVTNVACAFIENDSDMNYYGLSLYKNNNAAMTLIPLHERPAGYTISDALVATLVLQGTLEPADTTSRTLPKPFNPESEPTPNEYSTPAPTSTNGQAQSFVIDELATATPTAIPEATPALIATATPLPPPSAPPREDNNKPISIREKLQTLKQLYDEGLIDQKVYLEKQRAIIDKL